MRDVAELAAIIDKFDLMPWAMAPTPENVQELEQVIAELMNAAYKSSDQNEKVVISVLELRARAVRERWIKGGRN